MAALPSIGASPHPQLFGTRMMHRTHGTSILLTHTTQITPSMLGGGRASWNSTGTPVVSHDLSSKLQENLQLNTPLVRKGRSPFEKNVKMQMACPLYPESIPESPGLTRSSIILKCERTNRVRGGQGLCCVFSCAGLKLLLTAQHATEVHAWACGQPRRYCLPPLMASACYCTLLRRTG